MTGNYTAVGADTPLPAGAGVQTATQTVNELVDGQSTYMAAVVVSTTAQRVSSLIAGFAPPSQPAFVPINPVNRVLDTRTARPNSPRAKNAWSRSESPVSRALP